MSRSSPLAPILMLALASIGIALAAPLAAQPPPSMVDPRLEVRPWIEGLELPIGVAFLGRDDMLVLEKNSGKVLRVRDGVVRRTVLDLGVNFASERGLLGIALHPRFPNNKGVYLFWSCRTSSAPADSFVPSATRCSEPPSLGEDTGELLQVPLLANRVDRFRWNGSSLVFERNLITLRAFQNDAAPEPPGQGDQMQPARANHDGGVIRFGPDGKLYIIVGDLGRRGQLQNLPSGPTADGLGPIVPDDQFGGPEPDDAHLSGVILRLEDDGDIPTDNPFYRVGREMGGEVGENIQRIFAYGIRNSFGMAFDPIRGGLWFQENGEDAFDEINLARPGFNSGWIQVIGPLERLAQYREIETTSLHHDDFPNLQQFRWGPERIAQTPDEAEDRLFELRGSHYSDPEFSWKNVLAPAGIGFVRGKGLGRKLRGDLIVGFSVPEPEGGPLFRFELSESRRRIKVDDARLRDRVADNLEPHTMIESESLIFGRNFGVVTDIQTGPNGNLFVVSLSRGAIYEIDRARRDHDDDDDDDDGDDDDAQVASDDPALEGATGSPATGVLVERAPRISERAIHFDLGQPAHVRLTVHDLSGRTVALLLDGAMEVGARAVDWNRSSLPRGMYFVRLEASGPNGAQAVRTTKAVVLK
ncbi:MAG TPA: PQQ-dependent sugar dehydrogenase [Candidatus Limnocylindria bacterium]|nr:PQQ-dependent sugar dehydrogenase [Candidatus Limnocylindria bacterium]